LTVSYKENHCIP